MTERLHFPFSLALVAVHFPFSLALVAECGLQGMWASVVVAQGASCSAACGILPDQG